MTLCVRIRVHDRSLPVDAWAGVQIDMTDHRHIFQYPSQPETLFQVVNCKLWASSNQVLFSR